MYADQINAAFDNALAVAQVAAQANPFGFYAASVVILMAVITVAQVKGWF